MDTSINISILREMLTRFVREYAEIYNERDWWRPPLLASGHVDERFDILPEVAVDDHWLPRELMASAQTVVVFFIPLKAELAEENHLGKYPCPNWGIAYEVTNELIERACEHLQTALVKNGHEVVTMPATINYEGDAERLTARWSHKHLGYVCGLGRFGINAQFITPSGCAGRMGSLLTSADLGDHPLVSKAELCLHKVGRECLQCVERCPVGAVSLSGIDRHRCNKRLNFNWDHRIQLGLGERSHGCAKCQVNVPCSLTDPTTT